MLYLTARKKKRRLGLGSLDVEKHATGDYRCHRLFHPLLIVTI